MFPWPKQTRPRRVAHPSPPLISRPAASPSSASFADATPSILPRPLAPLTPGRDGRIFSAGAAAALGAAALLRWASHLPLARRIVRQFVWWAPGDDGGGAGGGSAAARRDAATTALVLYQEDAEAVEWVNMCVRKVGKRR